MKEQPAGSWPSGGTVPGMAFSQDNNGNTRLRSGAQSASAINVFIDGVGQKNYVLPGGITGQDYAFTGDGLGATAEADLVAAGDINRSIGKAEARRGRKMGHVTCLAPTLVEALAVAAAIKRDLGIPGADDIVPAAP